MRRFLRGSARGLGALVVLVITGWGTLALLNAGLAQVKGRGRLTWFLISLLLGPIATLLIVVSEYRRPSAGS